MAKHGESKHAKRSVVTRMVVIPRKMSKYYFRQLPGRHNVHTSVALAGMLRDVSGIAANDKEVKYLIKNSKVRVDGRIVREKKYPVGFNDVIDVDSERYVVSLDERGKLVLNPSAGKENIKKIKVVAISKARGGKGVLRLSDGENIIYDGTVQAGDSVSLDLEKRKVVKVTPFEQGQHAIVFVGKNAGKHGKIVRMEDEKVYLEKDGAEFSADATACMVV